MCLMEETQREFIWSGDKHEQDSPACISLSSVGWWVIFTVSFLLLSLGFDCGSRAAKKMATEKPCAYLWGFLFYFFYKYRNSSYCELVESFLRTLPVKPRPFRSPAFQRTLSPAGILCDTLHLAHFVSVDLLFIRVLHVNCLQTNSLC